MSRKAKNKVVDTSSVTPPPLRIPQSDCDVLKPDQASQNPRDNSSIQAAENEGMPTQAD